MQHKSLYALEKSKDAVSIKDMATIKRKRRV